MLGGIVLNERDVIQLLRHYRHDWSNDIQVIMGYAQMGKLDKVQEKLAQVSKKLEDEQRIQNTPLPKSILTMMKLNVQLEQFQLKPAVNVDKDMDKDFSFIDDKLAHHLHQVFMACSEHAIELVLYDATINIQQVSEDQLFVKLEFSDRFDRMRELKEKLLKFKSTMSIENHNKTGFQAEWIVK